MEKRRYALLGFVLVIIIGFIGFRSCSPQAVVSEDSSSQTKLESTSSPAAPASEKQTDKEKSDAEESSLPADNNKATTSDQHAAETDVTKADNEASSSEPDTQSRSDAVSASADNLNIEVPSFDVLRVEPDGDVVIAGRAAANSTIEVVNGSKILGTSHANEHGDFVVVFDNKLKAGDYQLVLRATGPDSKVATSLQTAIVSVPQSDNGDLLALVEEPGQASRMISLPQGKASESDNNNSENSTQGNNIIADNKSASDKNYLASAQKNTSDKNTEKNAENKPISVEAVEIEGETIYVAGSALLGRRVNVYANDIVLGSSEVSAEKRFLVRSNKHLEVGDYIIRADLLDNKNEIIASARVPFHRESGEYIAAVAPDRTSAQPTPAETVSPPKSSTADHEDQPKHIAKDSVQEAALEPAHGSIIIRKGDNLWTISKRNYGRGTRYTTIYSANRDQIKNPDLIWPGQVFTMPEAPLSDEETNRILQELAQ